MRPNDWQSRLQACIKERYRKPFEWGVHDCALFPADCVRAVTGVDPAELFRGQYSSAAGAVRFLQEHGGLAGLAARHLGEEIAPALARLGDIGLAANQGQACLAVCGGTVWYGPAKVGLERLPMNTITRAWRLPERD
jgi:hypothetical protein